MKLELIGQLDLEGPGRQGAGVDQVTMMYCSPTAATEKNTGPLCPALLPLTDSLRGPYSRHQVLLRILEG